jgi:hypothetical protein
MQLRRLTEQGIERLGAFLDSLTGDAPLPYPARLLEDPEATRRIDPSLEIEQRVFGTRYSAGEYFFNLFRDSGLADVERDRGLWAWLSLFYFEQLCPPDLKGKRRPGERARWIPEIGVSWRYYRHLLAGPYRIYAAHSDSPGRALLVLCGPLRQPGDIVEQIASRQEIITNSGIMEAACNLYYDASSSRPRRGAASKQGRGTVRRFMDILNQFDVTWDLYSLEARDVIQMLPDEFLRFRKLASP